MFSESHHPKMQKNRALEKKFSNTLNFEPGNFNVYYNIMCGLLQMCDECGLKNESKFSIKRCFDQFALKFPKTQIEFLEFAAMNFFRYGVKINEDPTLYDQLTIEMCMEKVSPQFTAQDFIDFEIQIYNNPEYSMNFTTPYDYLGLWAATFPMTESQGKKLLQLLNFSFTITELNFFSAEEIFFGCLLTVYKQNSIQKMWALGQTHSPQQSIKASKIITSLYEEQVQASLNPQLL